MSRFSEMSRSAVHLLKKFYSLTEKWFTAVSGYLVLLQRCTDWLHARLGLGYDWQVHDWRLNPDSLLEMYQELDWIMIANPRSRVDYDWIQLGLGIESQLLLSVTCALREATIIWVTTRLYYYTTHLHYWACFSDYRSGHQFQSSCRKAIELSRYHHSRVPAATTTPEHLPLPPLQSTCRYHHSRDPVAMWYDVDF